MAKKKDSNEAPEENESSQDSNGDASVDVNFDFSPLYFRFATFALLLCFIFSYFLYFSHQLSGSKSEIFTGISKINTIHTPYPLQFLSIIGHQEYYYAKRSEALREEFQFLIQRIDDRQLSDEDLAKLGHEIQRVITQIAFFYPYKRMLKFNKEGAVTFDSNKRDSMHLTNNMEIAFLKKQLSEIYNWDPIFRYGLKDQRIRIAQAMVLAGGFKDKYTMSRVTEYLNTLIAYLEEHHDLSVPLAGKINKYEFFAAKLGLTKIILFLLFLITNYVFGLLLPHFSFAKKKAKWFDLVAHSAFLLGIIAMLKGSFYSIPY